MNEKDRVQIFIACSGKATVEAQFLATKLQEQELQNIEIKPVKWWSTAKKFTTIIEKLVNHTKECDFAAILLTGEDLLFKANNGGEFAPRDNCVFEAGLFAGSFGPNLSRCFLLTSIDKDLLPSDLQGLEYIKFTESSVDTVKSEDSLEAAADAIGQALKEFKKDNTLHVNRGLKRPIITEGELIKLESLKSDNGNLVKGSSIVFVRSQQPLETGKEFAKQVMSNMINGTITYKYVFDKDRNTLCIIADLIAALVGVESITIKVEIDGHLIETQSPLSTDKNIETIKSNLRIYFLLDKPGIHYCIHNANRSQYAICYLKCPYSDETEAQFIEWCRNEKAVQIATEIGNLCKDPAKSIKRIFNPSIHYDLYEDQSFLNDLETELSEKLKPYSLSPEQISDIFFGRHTA